MTFSERARVKTLAHLEMTRPYTVFHSGLVAIAGIELASAGTAPAWRAALAGLVTMCGWVAGLYAGDYYDRNIDARSKPDRPIPSGRVSPREAFSVMVGLIAVGYAAALALSVANLSVAVATTVLGIAYSKTFKSQAILGNFDRGVLGICAVFFGALAGGTVWQPSVLLLAGLVFFHDSATNLVGAIRDVDGDRAAGCTTVPVVYGLARAIDIAVLLAWAWLVFAIGLLLSVPAGALSIALVAAGALLALWVYESLWWARGHATRQMALRAHKFLVVERLLIVSGVIAVYMPGAIALGLLVATSLLTVVSQALLRDRGERQRIVQSSSEAGAVGQ
jgi:geranylgeranylglycerol-phosphate geranylgeranyltransferase